jgi:hypothetical protein
MHFIAERILVELIQPMSLIYSIRKAVPSALMAKQPNPYIFSHCSHIYMGFLLVSFQKMRSRRQRIS